PDLTLHEVTEAAGVVSEAADPDAEIIFGAVIDPRLEGEIKITVIATGFEGQKHGQGRHFNSLAGLATAGSRFQPAARDRESGEEADLPAFIPRTRPSPVTAQRRERPETPLPEFLRSLRER